MAMQMRTKLYRTVRWKGTVTEDGGNDVGAKQRLRGVTKGRVRSSEEDMDTVPPYTLQPGCSTPLPGSAPTDYSSQFVDESMLQHRQMKLFSSDILQMFKKVIRITPQVVCYTKLIRSTNIRNKAEKQGLGYSDRQHGVQKCATILKHKIGISLLLAYTKTESSNQFWRVLPICRQS